MTPRIAASKLRPIEPRLKPVASDYGLKPDWSARWRTLMVDAHQVTLKSSSGSGAVWFLIYSAHTSSVTFPLLATQYPLPHKCWPQQRLRNTPNSLSNLWELRPFRYCTARDTDKLGGIDRSILHVVSIYRSGMNDHLVS